MSLQPDGRVAARRRGALQAASPLRLAPLGTRARNAGADVLARRQPAGRWIPVSSTSSLSSRAGGRRPRRTGRSPWSTLGPTGTPSVTLPCFDSWGFRTTVDPGDFASISRRLEPLSDEDAAMLAAKQFGRARVEVGPCRALCSWRGPRSRSCRAREIRRSSTRSRSPLRTRSSRSARGPRRRRPVGADAAALRRPVVPGSRRRPALGMAAARRRHRARRLAPPTARRPPPPGRGRAGRLDRDRVAGPDLRRSGCAGGGRRGSRPAHPASGHRPARRRLVVAAAGPQRPGRPPCDALAAARPDAGRRRRQRAAGPDGTHAGPRAGAGFQCRPADAPPPRRARPVGRTPARPRWRRCSRRPTAARSRRSCPTRTLACPTCSRTRTTAGSSPRRPRARYRNTLRDRRRKHTASLLSARSRPKERRRASSRYRPREIRPELDCRPLDLGAFASSVAAGVDPTVARPVVVDRVLAGLEGLREPVLAAPDVAPELDIPLWGFLSDNAPDWLLPGGGDIPPDRVLAVQTNPAFVEAVLIGANEQTLGELRWRNLPITSRWTPLRRFWQRINIDRGEVATDIRSVIALDTDLPLWPDNTELGDVSHLSDPTHGASLVVVLHTELFRRYPSTIVYLTPNPDGADVWGDVPNVDDACSRPRSTRPSAARSRRSWSSSASAFPPAAGATTGWCWRSRRRATVSAPTRRSDASALRRRRVREHDVRTTGPRLPGEPPVTARRDEVQTARDARRAGQVQAAQIAADLTALPGWLLVGDPGRLADPAQTDVGGAGRGAPRGAGPGAPRHPGAGRGARRARRRPPAADRPVPGVDELARGSAGRSDLALAARARSPAALPRRRTADDRGDGAANRRQRSRRTEATSATATAFVHERRPGRRRRLRPRPHCSCSARSARRRPGGRRAPAAAAGDALPAAWTAGPWTLRDARLPRPGRTRSGSSPTSTKHEADLVAVCWTQAGGDLTSDAGEAAFRSLAASVGGARAAYLLRTVTVVPEGRRLRGERRLSRAGDPHQHLQRSAPGGPAASGAMWATGSSCLASSIPTWRRSRHRLDLSNGDGRAPAGPGAQALVDLVREGAGGGPRGRGGDPGRPRRAAGRRGATARGVARHRPERAGPACALRATRRRAARSASSPR